MGEVKEAVAKKSAATTKAETEVKEEETKAKEAEDAVEKEVETLVKAVKQTAASAAVDAVSATGIAELQASTSTVSSIATELKGHVEDSISKIDEAIADLKSVSAQ